MGLINRGIPRNKTLELMDKFDIKNFIETGTHIGLTARWASLHFETVSTIERNAYYYQKAKSMLKSCPNVALYLGDSSDILRHVLRKTNNGLALVWLDAHWSRDLVYEKPEVICPVLRELEILRKDGRNHVIIVDDARLFGNKEGFPPREVIEKHLLYSNRIMQEFEDTLISCPQSLF